MNKTNNFLISNNHDKSRMIKCFHYQNPGHMKTKCRKFKREQSKDVGEKNKKKKDTNRV